MREYKIVEHPKGTFKAYRKKWWGWKSLVWSSYAGELDATFSSYRSAFDGIEEVEAKARAKEAAPKVWHFNGNEL